MTERHPLLTRQLSSLSRDALFDEVDRTYRDFERACTVLEQALVDTRRDLSAALAASGVSLWSWNAKHDETTFEGYPFFDGRVGPHTESASFLLELVHEDDRAGFRETLQRAASDGTTFSASIRFAPDPTRWINFRGRVDLEHDGRRLVGAVRDVTDDVERERASERRQAEERLHAQKIREVTSAAQLPDLDASLQVISARAREGLGVMRASVWQVEGDLDRLVWISGTSPPPAVREITRAAHPRYFTALADQRVLAVQDVSRAEATSELAPALEQEETRSLLIAVVRIGGRAEALLCLGHRGAPRAFTVGEQTFAASMADFVALALESSRRRRAERALEAQRAFLHQIIDLDPNLVSARDASGRLVLLNQALAELCGVPLPHLARTDGTGTPAAANLALLATGDAEVLATRREQSIDLDLRTAQGETRTFQVSKRAMVDPDGEVRSVLSVATDVTERRQAADTRRRLESELRQSQKLESLGLLAGGVAHDFNNLLVPILAVAEAAIAQLPPAHPLAEDLRDVLTAAQRGREITAQLLAFGRKQVLELVPLDVDAQLAQARRLLGRLVPENVRVEISSETRSIVRADATQLQQVLINLVANARDALPSGGAVVVHARRIELPGLPHAVEISVSDDGTGIDAEHLPHVFEPFYSTKRGSGLGLATSYGIVQAHGGSIRVESEVGRGTRFIIELPASDVEPGEIAAPPPTHEETIVVCEDEALVRRVLVRQLEGSGYRVVPTASAEEALAWLTGPEGAQASLLVTDVVLPRLSGPELVRTLEAKGRRIPHLFVSGHAHGVLAPSGVLDPNMRLLAKPFTSSELRTAVREVLDAAARRALHA